MSSSKYVLVCISILSISCMVHSGRNTFPKAQQYEKSFNVSSTANIALPDLIERTEQFALQLFQLMAREPAASTDDFVLSPFPIWTLLVVLSEGAAGNTYTQLEDVLRLPSDLTHVRMLYKHLITGFAMKTKKIELHTNQVIFSDQMRLVDFKFQSKLENYYNADYVSVNLSNIVETNDQINNYVSQRTHGKFNNVFDLDDLSAAQMLLISTIYFKGTWKEPFDPYNTGEQPFYDEDGNILWNVNAMFRTGGKITHIPELQSQALELEYGEDNHLSFIVLLPEVKTPLTTVADKLRLFGISKLMQHLSTVEPNEDIDIYLPRFNIDSRFELSGILSTMVLSDAFSDNANFTKITDYPVRISKFVHKNIIEVNENGTTAVGVSGAAIMFTILSSEFRVDRPFLFLIVEKPTNILAFCGQVKRPKQV